MYTAIIIPKPNGAAPLTAAINSAVPPGKEIVAITVDGNNLIIVYK
jgi:hypothetical protein